MIFRQHTDPPFHGTAVADVFHLPAFFENAPVWLILEEYPAQEWSSGMCCDSLNTRYVYRSFRDRQIMIALKVDPETAAITEQLAESHRHLCGNRLFPIQDFVERLPRDSERICHRRLAHRQRRQDILAQYFAGVDGLY